MRNILEQWEHEKEYRRSEAHQTLCRIYEAESLRLTAIASDLSARLNELIADCTGRTVRNEYAEKGAFLHRGVYCPSPACDLIFATRQRGQLVESDPEECNVTHSYGFDSAGTLLWCSHFRNGEIYKTEYLIHQDNKVYGLTVGLSRRVEEFSEEVYDNGKLIRYATCMFDLVPGPLDCCSLYCEELEYNCDGLAACLWHSLLLADTKSVCHGDRCRFHRENGLVTHYSNRAGHVCKVSPPRSV